MPDTSIPGGAYQNPDGTWHDANGQPLSKAAVEKAQEAAEEQNAQRAEQERLTLLSEVQRDPTARALAAALAPQTRSTQTPATIADDQTPKGGTGTDGDKPKK